MNGAVQVDAMSVVMLGATGAVGNQAALTLSAAFPVTRLTLLGRRPAENIVGAKVSQHAVDVFEPASYDTLLAGHHAAICTLGVGQPSKMSKAEFVKTDHDAVVAFATACKLAGIPHFSLLSSVGADVASASFFLRTKGQLEQALVALRFDRLSLFHPSMILTPSNRYGFTQAVTLAVTPVLNPLLIGPLRKFRGIKVETLGRAMAINTLVSGRGVETWYWDDIRNLSSSMAFASFTRGESDVL